MTDRAKKLLEILAEVLSFNRPVSPADMTAEARDLMAAWGAGSLSPALAASTVA